MNLQFKKTLRCLFVLTFLVVNATIAFGSNSKTKVDIVVSNKATSLEVRAATELSNYLKAVYPTCQFAITIAANRENMSVQLGMSEFFKNNEVLLRHLPTQAEGFLIRSTSEKQVIITSYSEKGLFNAVYSLLEKLGYDFYVSYDALPKQKSKLVFADWNLTDSPLQPERIMFDWHNFLSGCTGWDYKDWCYWIDQSAKMRYNTIMLHAYGNNPMTCFEYNGKKKDVGFINTSNSGRDWGAQHINDVRLLPGGEVFDQPVFGTKEAQVLDNIRVEAISGLMNRVFDYASKRAMKINLAVDIDTWSANPKNIINTLPSECLIKTKEQNIVNPDTTSGGYDYYKAQVKSLLTDYPQLNTITVWVRYNGTLWRDNMKDSVFPDNWRKEWAQLKMDHPEFLKDKQAESIFAFSKVVIAYQKALRDLKRTNVSINFGSWGPEFMPSAAVIMPQNCTLISLDNLVRFETDWYTGLLKKATAIHKVIPIVWAHHDDHRYMGRPYTPYANFNKMLNERNAAGFGIIHWTTRPLDLYFKSLGDQVWGKTENISLDSSISHYNQSVYGSQQPVLQQYMTEWIIKGPMFGRETSTHFFDLGKQKFGEKFEPVDVTLLGIKNRIEMLKNVKTNELSAMGLKMFNYNSSMEQYYLSLFQNHQKFMDAYGMIARESYDSARVILQTVNPEKTIEIYSKASSILPITPGEKAMVVSMGTRWYPDYENLKQRARMSNVYYKFATTQHDSLAQAPGNGTYFIDNNNTLWTCRGVKALKTGITGVFNANEAANLPANSQTYFKISKPFTFYLTTLDNNSLAPGKYKLEVQYVGANLEADDCKLVSVSKNVRAQLQTTLKTSGKMLKTITTEFEVKTGEKPSLSIEPQNTELRFTNLIINPID